MTKKLNLMLIWFYFLSCHCLVNYLLHIYHPHKTIFRMDIKLVNVNFALQNKIFYQCNQGKGMKEDSNHSQCLLYNFQLFQLDFFKTSELNGVM